MTHPSATASPRHLRGADAQQFLAEASALLGAPGEVDATLQSAARLALATGADFCLLDLARPGGQFRRHAAVHADPWDEARCAFFQLRDAPDSEASPVAEAFRAARSVLVPEVTDTWIEALAAGSVHRQLLRDLRPQSAMHVPLRAGEQVLGVLTLVLRDPERRYDGEDLDLVEELARCAAAALERARYVGRVRVRSRKTVLAARPAESQPDRLRENEERLSLLAEGLRVISSRARCLLWYADVEDRGERALEWSMRMADEEAARRFLPVVVLPGQAYGAALSEARLPEDRARMAWGDEEIRAGRSYRQEFRVRDAQGQVRWLVEEVQIEPVGPDRWNAVGICVDISERKRLEEELLEQATALAQADRRKDEFLAMLAHELRNPLGAIANSLALLRQPEAPDGARRRALEVLDRQVRHQARMVDDLLDVSRISRGLVEIRPAPLDLVSLARETVEDCRPGFREQEVALRLELGVETCPVAGDRVRLAQVFGNLLGNALKFTPRGGEVTVTVEIGEWRLESEGPASPSPSTSLRSPHAVVRIRDTGAGIEAEVLPYVFETFVQGDQSLARTQGGLGLGLALVRGLVELHGGTISARSDGPGKGAELTIYLPISECGLRSAEWGEGTVRTPEPNPKSEIRTPKSRRVLVIEDHADAAESLRDLLELAGCAVELARSGPEGLEAARRLQPEVVLCDIGLPDMDGYQVAAALRADPATAGTRLIAISGYGREEDRRRAGEAGFDHYMIKPVAIDALYRLVRDEDP